MFHIFLSFTLAKWAWFYPFLPWSYQFSRVRCSWYRESSRCKKPGHSERLPIQSCHTTKCKLCIFDLLGKLSENLWKRSCPSPILCFVPSLFDGSIPRTLQAAPAKANGGSSPRNEAPVEAHGFLQVLLGRWTFTRGTGCSLGYPISWWFGSLVWLWPRLAEVCWSSL